MGKLRTKEALARDAKSDSRAVENRRSLEAKIEEAMDRWQFEAEEIWPADSARASEAIANLAGRVLSRYGATLF